jgi:hypothetical protein
MTSFVYMIGEEGSTIVKIGKANNPAERLSSLQTGNPTPLTVMSAHEGDHQLESHLHTVFADYRVRGEWFDLAPLGDPVAAMQGAVAAAGLGALPKIPGPRTVLPETPAEDCACGHPSVQHNRSGCTVAGWDETRDCQCERYVPKSVLTSIAPTDQARLPRPETTGWQGPSPSERNAVYADPHYNIILAEAGEATLPSGVLALSGYWPEALAVNVVWRLRRMSSADLRVAIVLDEALHLRWPDGVAMLPGVLAEAFARKVVERLGSV